LLKEKTKRSFPWFKKKLIYKLYNSSMKQFFLIPFSLFMLFSSLQAKDITLLAKELNLQAGTKATVQWERIFSSQRHIKKYKLEHLSLHTRTELKSYLIKHAADSEQPIVPGL